jgi:hypothetical protein
MQLAARQFNAAVDEYCAALAKLSAFLLSVKS